MIKQLFPVLVLLLALCLIILLIAGLVPGADI